MLNKPDILPAEELGVHKAEISQNAIKVVQDLQEGGFEAYLVGGCVRDLLLQKKPKDFDVATSATPEQIRQLFSNCRLIGRRFRLAHIRFGYEVIEVATFRAGANGKDELSPQQMSQGDQGQLLRDNVYGTRDEDAERRDFTVNALYYDPIKDEIIDYTKGLDDIKSGTLRSIGDPDERFREDPVRMLRLVRFAAKLGFVMEENALNMVKQEGKLLSSVSPARMFEEVLKLFHGGAAHNTFLMLLEYGLFKYLFPFTEQCLVQGVEGMPERALRNTDKRIQEGKPVIPAFLFACMLWDPVRTDAMKLMDSGMSDAQAWRIAMNDALQDQSQYVAVPRRLAEIILDIWNIHFRLIKRNPRMILQLLNNRRFRAAYDFLLLRAQLHEVDQDIVDWWTKIQEIENEERPEMISELDEHYENSRTHEDGEANGNSINYVPKKKTKKHAKGHHKSSKNSHKRSRSGKLGSKSGKSGGKSGSRKKRSSNRYMGNGANYQTANSENAAEKPKKQKKKVVVRRRYLGVRKPSESAEIG